MCGIVGLISHLSAADGQQRVEEALRGLRHRGPDGEGLFVQPPGSSSATLVVAGGRRQLPALTAEASDTRGVALAHCRLAIIDLTPAAAQPMVTAGGRYAIVFNGEIYNYLELRAELESGGHPFRTRSDTEVLLIGYQEWGLGVLDRVVGMFAFALLDRAEQTVLLARDDFGMKPLYYASSTRGFGFASEPRALLALLGLRPKADDEGLADYLVHGLTDHRVGTMFAGVRAVPAASHIRLSLRGATVPEPVRHWTPVTDRTDDRPPTVIARDLRRCFLKSVQLHLRGDAKVGTLLSGGIDSSAIVMAMREVGGASLDIRTFSYIPEAGAISEERWIDEVNAAAGAIPHKVRITRHAWEQEAGALAEHQGEPFGSLAIYAQSALFRSASEAGVRVLLDGQGADEMLAGYAMFRGVRMAGHIRRAEYGRALRVARALGGDGGSWRQTVARYLDVVRLILPEPAASMTRRRGLQHAVVQEAWLRSRGIRPRRAWQPTGRRPLQERLRDALEISSLPALLRFADRSAMMHSVESRLPFLTRELVQFALALPDHLLVSDDGVGKAIFRDAMRGLVPDSVLDRREKVGFAVPLGEWLLGSRYAGERATVAAGLPCVDAGRVRPWIDDLDAGRRLAAGPTFLVWRLIGLSEWTRQYNVSVG